MSKQENPTLDQIRRILYQDRIWSAYAIMDLQPAFAPYCHWAMAESAQGEGVALLYTGLTPPIIVTVGAVEPLRQAILELPLPDELYLSVRMEHYPLLAAWYNFDGSAHPMQRMKFVEPSKIATPKGGGLYRLGVADADRLQQLYDQGGEFAPSYFDPYQLEDGVYFGIRSENDELIAAGGTHIVDRQEKIAAIGNMYTQANQRGKGHASTILQAIVQTLLDEGFADVFLNVDPANHNAQRIYQRYGFVDYCRFMEGKGVRKE